jgi:hypothetical protein
MKWKWEKRRNRKNSRWGWSSYYPYDRIRMLLRVWKYPCLPGPWLDLINCRMTSRCHSPQVFRHIAIEVTMTVDARNHSSALGERGLAY